MCMCVQVMCCVVLCVLYNIHLDVRFSFQKPKWIWYFVFFSVWKAEICPFSKYLNDSGLLISQLSSNRNEALQMNYIIFLWMYTRIKYLIFSENLCQSSSTFQLRLLLLIILLLYIYIFFSSFSLPFRFYSFLLFCLTEIIMARVRKKRCYEWVI